MLCHIRVSLSGNYPLRILECSLSFCAKESQGICPNAQLHFLVLSEIFLVLVQAPALLRA